MSDLTRLHVAPSPHIASPVRTSWVMTAVIVALAPSALWSVWLMGWTAAALFAVSIGSCVLTEWLWTRVAGRPSTLGDLSAVLTGALVAMTLPPRTPLWMAAVAGVVAIGLGKMIFGGLGWNIFNPALVGRAVVGISWAGVLAEVRPYAGGWYAVMPDVAAPGLDTVSGATRLAIAAADRAAGGAYGFEPADHYRSLLLSNTQGSLGEVSAALLVAGGLFLVLTRVVDWRIPLGYLGTVVAISAACGSDPLFNVLAGGVLLGAFFMATDYVTSPMDPRGRFLFGVGCGVFNMVVRLYGPMPEATTFAILFMNGLVPLIDRAFRPRTFGRRRQVA